MLSIRQAKPEDAPVLAQTERLIVKTPGFLVSKPHELKEERFRETITKLLDSENGHYIVGEIENKMVGHALLNPLQLEANQHVAFLNIVVHPDYQAQGIGKALLSHLIEWAKSSPKVEKIGLHVRSSNIHAQALYKKLGFVEEGRWTRVIKNFQKANI